MKPIGELNRSPVLVLYWVLFGAGGNFGERRASGGLLPGGLGQWLAAGKCGYAGRGSLHGVSRLAVGRVVMDGGHTSSEPCLEGSAGALVIAAVKVMSYPCGGWRHCGRAAEF